MKYCKICKITAKESDTLCAKGHPLSVFGASPQSSPKEGRPSDRATKPTEEAPGPGSPINMITLRGEIQKLEEAKKKNVNRGRAFGLLSFFAAVAIVSLLYQVYSRTVLAFAILENVMIEQDPSMDWGIRVSYDVKTPGKVAFDRRSGVRRTEKLDVVREIGTNGFIWVWPSDPKTGIDFHVRYRSGWLLTSVDRHFDVSAPKIPGLLDF